MVLGTFISLYIINWFFLITEKWCVYFAVGTEPLNIFEYVPFYLLTPRCRVLLEKLTGLQLVKKFPAFHGTRRFFTALTSVRQLSLYWASPIQSTYPHPTSWRSILILSTHLHLGLPIGLLPSGFPTKTLFAPFSSPIRATCPAHLILLDFITRTILGEEYRSFSSSLCHLLHLPCINQMEKCINNQQMHKNIYGVFYSQYSHQRVSAGIPSIFRVLFLLQECNCD